MAAVSGEDRFRCLSTLLGVLVTPRFLFIIVSAIGSGNGTSYAYYLAKIFFPWTMMSTAITTYLTTLSFLLGARSIRSTGSFSIGPALPTGSGRARALVAVHFFAIILSGTFSDRSFTP